MVDPSGEFSVAVFYRDGTYTYEKRFVDGETAVKTAASFTRRPAAQIGMISRVVITDGGDCTNFEWKFGEGVVFPEDMKGAK